MNAENLRIPYIFLLFPNTNTNERLGHPVHHRGELTLGQQQLQRLRGLGQGGEVEGGLTSTIL